MNRLAKELTPSAPSAWKRVVVSTSLTCSGSHAPFRSLLQRCSTLLPVLMVLGSLLAANVLIAQDAAETASQPSSEADAEPEIDNFSKSLILPRDRTAERELKQIAELAARQEWSLIAQRLELFIDDIATRNLRQDEADLVELDGVASSKESAVARLFEQLPQSGRSAVLRLLEPVAQRQLTAAVKVQDATALQLIARRYRGTEAGQKARTLLRQLLRDRGQFVDSPQVTSTDTSVPTTPSAASDWVVNVITPPVTQEIVAKVHHLLRQSGANPFPTSHIASGPKTLIATLASRRLGINSQTGQILWTRETPGYAANWYRNPGDLGDVNRTRLFSQTAVRRVFGEAVFAQTSLDESRCYFLEALNPESIPKPQDDSTESSTASSLFARAFPANQLICVDQATGDILWTQAGQPTGSVYFAGTPVVQDGSVWVLGESDLSKTLTLYQFEARTGDLISSLPVALAKLGIAEDARRLDVDCQVLIDGDQLICPTAAGGLFSIDRLTGDVLWAYRFPRRDAIEFPAEFNEIATRTGFEYWNGWQSSRLLATEDVLISVTPEREKLHVMDRANGQSLWSTAYEDGLDIAIADVQHGVVVIEKTTAQANDVRTGKQLWKTIIPQPAGRGFVDGHTYVFPILNAGVAHLDLSTGELQTDLTSAPQFAPADGVLPYQIRPRNLFSTGGVIYEIHADGARRLRTNLPKIASRISSKMIDEARQTLESGDLSLVRKFLTQKLSDTVDTTPGSVRKALLKLLADQYSNLPTSQAREKLASDVNTLTETVAEKAAWRREIASNALHRQDFKQFSELWVTAPADEMQSLLPAIDGQSRARLDRWFQQAALSLSTELQPALDTEISNRISMLSSEDQSQVLERLGQTPWGQALRIKSIPSPQDLPALLTTQLRLLEQSETNNTQMGAGAAYRLYQLYQARGNQLDAARWLNRLAHFSPEMRLPDGKRVEEVCSAAIAPLQKLLETDPSLSPWPAIAPKAELKARSSRELYLVPLQIMNSSESGFERIAAELDYPGHAAIRFSGGLWPRPWYCAIPKTQRNLRMDPALDQGWGLEQLLILQTGSELFGISPFDFKGAPKGTVIWPPDRQAIDTLGDRENLMITYLSEERPQRLGFITPESRRLDEFEHYLTAVGPITAGYICFQQTGMLVAIDPATGKELWRRYDLPRRADCYGNDRQVIVTSPESQEVTIYSAINGQQIGVRPRTHDPRNVVASQLLQVTLIEDNQAKRHATEDVASETVSPDQTTRADVVIRRLDLKNGETLWQRHWPPHSIPFEIDDRWMGITTAADQIEVFDQRTGATISRYQHALPGRLDHIYCSITDEDLLLIFSDPVSEVEFRKSAQIRGGYRRPWINGSVLCIDRQTGQERWFRQLGVTEFPLDQPTEFPVMMTAEARSGNFRASEEKEEAEDADQSKTSERQGVIVRCYDRRSGHLLQEIHHPDESLPSYTIQGLRKEKNIRLQTLRSRLEIDYLSQREEPAQPPSR